VVTIGEARAEYLERNGFSLAAYDEPWVRLRLFGVPLAFPNVRSRRRAIRFHDVHHVVTGYDTDPRGEAEIAAWEIAATFGHRGREYLAAWVLNTAMFTLGLALAPRRVFRAFVRGRHCTSLYHVGWSDTLVGRDVESVRSELGLDRSHAATWRDRALFAGLVSGLLVPPALVALWIAGHVL
jgi:hypothetical protein